MRKLFFILILFSTPLFITAQENDISLGAQYTGTLQRQGGFFDYSDPESINMRVSVWGFVRYPGRYLVPIYTTVTDLLSYAGGPYDNSNIDDLRLYRVMEDSTQHMIKFNFNDLLWAESIEATNRRVPKLQAGDLLVVPGEPRLYFQNWFRVGLAVFSSLVSLALLIISIDRY